MEVIIIPVKFPAKNYFYTYVKGGADIYNFYLNLSGF